MNFYFFSQIIHAPSLCKKYLILQTYCSQNQHKLFYQQLLKL